MNSGLLARKLGKSFSYFQRKKAGNTKRPTLYLHVGLPKTGSSAIQNICFQNREALQKQGVFYPDSSLHWSQHVPLAKAILAPLFPDAHFNSYIPTVELSDWYNELQSRCEENGYRKVVVSSEFLWAAPAMQSSLEYHEPTKENFNLLDQAIAAYKTAFSWFDTVKVIVYLRRQDRWLESFFNQQIKDGFTIPKEQEILSMKNYLLFSKNLALWEKHFGKENIMVRNFANCNGDVVNDFCNILSISKDGFASSSGGKTVNHRLSASAVKSMRLAIENKVEPKTLDLLGDVLRYTSSRITTGGQYGVFSKAFHQEVFSIYEEDNIKLAERYPVCEDFCRLNDTSPQGVPDSSPSSPEEQIELLLETLLPSYVEQESKP